MTQPDAEEAAVYPPPGLRDRYGFVPHPFRRRAPEEMLARASEFERLMQGRRSSRVFSSEPVSRELVDIAISIAATAPSGAHQQPWTFVVVGDPETKRRIRVAAEEEERVSYEGGRMPPEWLSALEPLGTTWEKPYLEVVPWIVVCFEQRYGLDADGSRRKHYYVSESVGIACGLFITALHYMGLTTLTHTPSPMGFLSEILRRPRNEAPYILFPVGYPAEGSLVPDLRRKPLDEVRILFGPRT
jgi:iodotyrosine deiodinase